jgi:hypothetical protein
LRVPTSAAGLVLVIALLDEVCDELGLGRSPAQVATDVTKNSNLDGYHAGYFVGLAIRTYCPQHAS